MQSMDIRADQRQSQTLSPRLQHAVRLLQMSSLDFAAMVRDTLGKNPFLEAEDMDGGGDDGDVQSGSASGDGHAAGAHGDTLGEPHGDQSIGQALSASDRNGSDFDQAGEHGGEHAGEHGGEGGSDGEHDSLDRGDNGDDSHHADYSEHSDSGDSSDSRDDRDLWSADGIGSGQRRNEDGEFSALDLMAAETSLNAHLHGQLNVLPLPPRDLALARTLVESLDDDGYLRTPLEELLEVAALNPPAHLEEMQIALKRVQSLDPAGVGARSVAECLLLQLPGIACTESRALAQRIISGHLAALASRDVTGMAKRLGESPARVEAVCDRIRRLDPRPGWRLGSSQVAYVVPDVVVKKRRGVWTVQLNPAVVPKVRLNQVYAALFQRHRTAANADMGAHLHEARWTLRNVEQRFSTILDVANAIVKRQSNFLEYGAMAMKPLGLREIADEVGMHESTVSRVTNNKYMSTPIGVFELKYFFSRAMISANGSACSGTAIRGLVKDIIEAESTNEPLSDAEITRQLAQQGLVVARRTVTKYRQMLKIDAVDRRRRQPATAEA